MGSRYSGSDRYNPNAGVSGNAPPPTSTFKNGGPPYLPGYQPNHDYDTPEGAASESRNPATVTINGIAVWLFTFRKTICLPFWDWKPFQSCFFYLVKKYHSVKKKKKKHNVPPESISKLCYVSSLKIWKKTVFLEGLRGWAAQEAA